MADPSHFRTDLDSDREAVAIMVHGTFSAADEDEGDRWWQSASDFAQRLQSLLPASVRVAKEGEVFHWSGANSERARSKAAANLLRHLHKLEEQGHDYHLIGHSHGGSVIWNALQFSVLVKRPLKGLRSWTTVGTPFLQHRGQGTLSIKNLISLIIGLILLFPATWAPRRLLITLRDIATNNPAGVVLESDEAAGYSNILRAPVLSLVEGFGVKVDHRPDGVVIGSFDPSGDQTLAKYYLATPEGLFLLILMLGLSYVFVHVALLCISPAIEAYRIRLEQRLKKRAFGVYGARWLGISSPDDEAINGLRATLSISVSFVSKMMPREVVFLSDILALLSRPYYWLVAPLYNWFVYPAVDSQVRRLVIRAAQGNDRPNAFLIDVTPTPLVETADAVPPFLPALLNVKLLAFANRHAHELVPKLRGLIAQSSFASGLELFGERLSGKELVHTSYFEHAEILKLIAANMACDSSEIERASRLKAMPPWLRRWFLSFKSGVNAMPEQGSNAAVAYSISESTPAKQKTA